VPRVVDRVVAGRQSQHGCRLAAVEAVSVVVVAGRQSQHGCRLRGRLDQYYIVVAGRQSQHGCRRKPVICCLNAGYRLFCMSD
jgi:hypothetical protein